MWTADSRNNLPGNHDWSQKCSIQEMESCPVMLPDCMSEEQWSIYQRVIADCRAAGLPFAVGGGLAIGVYTGRWRNTKDIDLYVLRKDVERAKEILNRAGLVDYYDQLPYDRAWIYRSVHDKTIVDVIFSMANHKSDVDETWIMGGPEITIALVDRLGADAPLLRSVLTVFGWLCPALTRKLPRWLWEETEKPAAESLPPRADLLDRREWFSPAAEC